jgi:transposase
MKVLQLTRAQRAAALSDDVKGERTGILTSEIVATDEGRQIALFFTGVRRAGENLNAVLGRRRVGLPPPGLGTPKDRDRPAATDVTHRRRGSPRLRCYPISTHRRIAHGRSKKNTHPQTL